MKKIYDTPPDPEHYQKGIDAYFNSHDNGMMGSMKGLYFKPKFKGWHRRTSS